MRTHDEHDEPTELVTITACSFCAHTELARWLSCVTDRLEISKKLWHFLCCLNCGAAVLSPRPRHDDLSWYYPDDYLFKDGKKAGTLLHRLYAWLEYHFYYRFTHHGITTWLRRYQQDGGAKKRLLDIGCGMGQILQQAAKEGFEAYGVDFSAANIAYVNTLPRVKAYCTDITHLATLFTTERFDVITAIHVLEHVTQPVEMLKQWGALLQPGGQLIVSVPVIDCLQARISGRRWLGVTDAPRHITVPSRRALQQAFAAAGFTQVTMRPKGILDSASLMAVTLLPKSAEHFQHGHSLLPKIHRLAAGIVMLVCVPFALLESYLLKSPAVVTVYASK